MRLLCIFAMATATLVLANARLSAQEMIATPDPAGQHAADSAAPSAPNPVPNRWRYRWFQDRWWYWTPGNHWMWYNDDGQWVEYEAKQNSPPVFPREVVPLPNQSYPNLTRGYYDPGPYYPVPGYWTGRYPGVAVGAAPYGRVGVGVGRRVGVDVWGPHGAVRVGRIHVGW